ncbi:hypothetical protein [Enterobacter soli]|uniref:hypothetical protein n=1 Tax=Enterobacter soli TaxID=885040 RepID=UPI003EDB09CA
MAKMFTRLAERLDCTTAALREKGKQCDALAAENAALKAVISEIRNELYGHGFQVFGWYLNGALEPLDSWFEENNRNPETPSTEAFLVEVRAQVCMEVKDLAKSAIASDSTDQIDFLFDGKAAQLRKGFTQ